MVYEGFPIYYLSIVTIFHRVFLTFGLCERPHENLLTYMTIYYIYMTYSKSSKFSRHIYVIFGGVLHIILSLDNMLISFVKATTCGKVW